MKRELDQEVQGQAFAPKEQEQAPKERVQVPKEWVQAPDKRMQTLDTQEARAAIDENGVGVIRFPCFEELAWLAHGFSTRIGGVSKGTYASMNLSFTRGDDPEDVMRNFQIFGKAIGIGVENMVFSAQTHTDHIRIVTEADCGKGIIRKQDYTDTDGLITQEKGVALVTFFADCIPLFFVDVRLHVIASSHSGWRGTVKGIGAKTLRMMQQTFGCCLNDIIVVIGPGICQDCYEVSQDVADAFTKAFPPEEWAYILRSHGEGHYLLNLWKANELLLIRAGLPASNIHTAGICTHCHSDLLWSHRTQGSQRGSLAGFLMLL